MSVTLAETGTARVTERPAIYHARQARKGRNGKPPSQDEFAAKVGIHPITLSKAESYGRFIPGKKLAAILGKFLDRTPGEVIDDYARHAEPRKAVAS